MSAISGYHFLMVDIAQHRMDKAQYLACKVTICNGRSSRYHYLVGPFYDDSAIPEYSNKLYDSLDSYRPKMVPEQLCVVTRASKRPGVLNADLGYTPPEPTAKPKGRKRGDRES